MKNKSLVALLIAAMMIFVAGCTLPTGGGPGPRVWIDTPLNGDLLAFGPLVVKSHVSSEGGTTSAALLVNGVQIREDTPTDPSAPLTSFAQVWEPTSPGDYGLEVVATDSAGNTGRTLVRVQISVETYIPPLCRLDQLVAPELLEPADGASVPAGAAARTRVHFSWSYPEPSCRPSGYYISLSEPDGSADHLVWGFITPSALYTTGDWPLPAGACYYWQVAASPGSVGEGPPSAVRRFCIPSLTASLPGSTTVTASVPLPGITVTIPPVIPPNLIPTFIFTTNANCRQGPDTAYAVVTSFFANDQVTIEGRNDNSSWYWALIPNSNSHCWVSGKTGTPQGPMGGLVVVAAPALPATTVAPPPVVVATTPVPAPVAPDAPGGFNVSTKSCNSSEYVVTLQWSNVKGELGYRIYRDGALIATLPDNSTTYDDASPDYLSHSYQVQSYNAAGSANSSAQNSEGCMY